MSSYKGIRNKWSKSILTINVSSGLKFHETPTSSTKVLKKIKVNINKPSKECKSSSGDNKLKDLTETESEKYCSTKAPTFGSKVKRFPKNS